VYVDQAAGTKRVRRGPLGVGAIGSPDQEADFIGRLVSSGATAIAVERLRRDPRQQEEPMTEHLLPLVT
jgi:xanthine/CO dehydrogenase XdhC/CoxF family maturation factor